MVMIKQNSNYLYGGYTLRKGDNDKRKIWAGKKHSSTGSYVEALQKDLKKIGVYLNTIDGDFGQLTDAAAKRFQWNAKNFTVRMTNTGTIDAQKTYFDKIDGIVGKNTKKEVDSWIGKNHSATGDIIRVKGSNFKHMELNDSFKKIIHPNVCNDELVISSAMLEYLKYANQEAKDLSLTIVINQALRVNGVKVSGAVVTPAKKSQHLIGHAIDCNIVDGGNWNTSSTFKKNKETENAKKFISAVKTKGLRWGGDFAKADTPHFDKLLLANGSDYNYKYFFNQRMISEKQFIPLKTW